MCCLCLFAFSTRVRKCFYFTPLSYSCILYSWTGSVKHGCLAILGLYAIHASLLLLHFTIIFMYYYTHNFVYLFFLFFYLSPVITPILVNSMEAPQKSNTSHISLYFPWFLTCPSFFVPSSKHVLYQNALYKLQSLLLLFLLCLLTKY